MAIHKRSLSLLIWLLWLPFGLLAQEIPAPTGFVNDFAKILTAAQISELDAMLTQQAEGSSNEIAVVTILLPDNETPETYAYKIFSQWGIGGSTNNNGALIILYPNAKKVRIETGYGLEGAIPDIVAGNIIQKDMIPHFRAGDFYSGLKKGAETAHILARGDYDEATGRRYYTQTSQGGGSGEEAEALFFLVLIIVIVFFIYANTGGGGGRGRGRGYWHGGTYYWGTGGRSYGRGSGGGFGGGFGGGGGSFGGFGGGLGGGGGATGGW